VEESLAAWGIRFASAASTDPSARHPAAARAAIAPHAGWIFSGRLAARSVAALVDAQTVAVIGGHLPPSAAPLVATEDAFDTPLGPLEADGELRSALEAALAAAAGDRLGRRAVLRPDDVADNTVEVQLPLVKARFPAARLVWLRAPNGPAALTLGSALAAAAASLGRSVACLGSTDLTHYGPAYGFSPKGRGSAAESWVREVNDRGLIEALLALDPAEVLRRGEEEGSACSSGAAAAALSFALASGAKRAELLGYATSLEVHSDSSFVGYAAVGWY